MLIDINKINNNNNNDNNNDLTIIESAQIYGKWLYFSSFVGIKILLRYGSGCHHQPFFYNLKVILIVLGCFQKDMDGFRPFAAGSM